MSGQYSGIGGVQIGFVVIAGVTCIAVMTRVVVDMNRLAVAQWQLGGLSSRRASWTVFLMVVGTSLLGSAVGVALGGGLWPAFGRFVVSSGLPIIGPFSRPLGVASILSAFGTGVVVSALAGLLDVRSVGHVEAVEAVRQHPMETRPISAVRVVLALLLSGGLVVAYWGMSRVKPSTDMNALSGVFAAWWGTALLLMVIVLVAGGSVILAFLRLWSGVVPAGRAVSWFLARCGALCRGQYASAMIVPLFVAGGTVGAIYGMAYQTEDAVRVLGGGSVSISPPKQMILVFGGPVIVAMATTIATVIATSEQTSRDLGRLSVVGVGRASLVRSVAWEYVIYCATTLMVCYGVLALNSAAAASAIARGPIPGAHPVFAGWSPLVVIGVGFALAFLAALLPLACAVLGSPVAASRGTRR